MGPVSISVLIAFAASMSSSFEFAILSCRSVSINLMNSSSGSSVTFSLSWSSSGTKSGHREGRLIESFCVRVYGQVGRRIRRGRATIVLVFGSIFGRFGRTLSSCGLSG